MQTFCDGAGLGWRSASPHETLTAGVDGVSTTPSSSRRQHTDVHPWRDLMRLRTKEIDIVRACLDWLTLHRIRAWRMNNTGIFDPSRKVFRTFHGERGIPDILGIFPQTVTLEDGTTATFGNFLGI